MTLETTSRQQAAKRAVERLRGGRSPGKVPESKSGWNHAFVSAIRGWKDRFRDSADLRSALEIVSDQLYGKDIHWALELIQNAEDAGAKKITFEFDRDEVRVTNDGKPFTAADVWGICSVGQSRKKNKIGFFGIGFKSVHEVTHAPEIRSGPYALRLEDKIYPTPLPPDVTRPHDGSLFVLPIRGDRRSHVEGMVDQLTRPALLHLLLTLNSLSSLEVVDLIGGRSGRFYRERLAQDPAGYWDEYRIGGTWPEFEEQTWRRYEFETGEVPAGLSRQGRDLVPGERSQIVLARPADGGVRESQLHCFLPVDVPSELRWLVQADFDPTPGRERLRENDWNRWLFGEVGKAVADAVSKEVRDGSAPWPFIPLREEIRDDLQAIACSEAVERLRSLEFLRTVRGWQLPSRAAWPAYAELRDIVRETDLATIGTDASYLSPWLMPVPSSPGYERSLGALKELGAVPVNCEHLIELLGKPDKEFYRGDRSGGWWLTALEVLRRQATVQQRESLREVACIPVQGTRGRMAPSPDVAMEGYLIAFSRTNNLKDLRAFFEDSDVFLVDSRVAPRPSHTQRKNPQGSDTVRELVRDFLIGEPFHVARDAGPYHVVRDLILPRMGAFAGLNRLRKDHLNTLSRMVEYTRQKWPRYVTEYKKYRRKGASEEEIASELSVKFRVVARVMKETGSVKRVVSVADAYLSSGLLGFEGMDVALKGSPGVAVVDAVHEKALTSEPTKGRRQLQAPSVTAFLRMLGGNVGPNVSAQDSHYVSEAHTPWVDWDAFPQHKFRGRDKGLEGDWVCSDLDLLMRQWEAYSARERMRRGRALWNSVQEGWDDLGQTVRARPSYRYYGWKTTGAEAFSTWIGKLSQIPWVEAADGSLRRPAELVLDTSANRLVLAKDGSRWVGRPVHVQEAALALGLRAEPSTDAAVGTLRELRNGTLTASEKDTLKIARACYELLARGLNAIASEEERGLLEKKFREDLSLRRWNDGLIFAPPRLQQGGSSWWPHNRVLRDESAVTVAGPHLGYLGSRYKRATALWSALRVERDLTPGLIARVIEDLARGEDGTAASGREYYGRLVAALEKHLLTIDAQPSGAVPALTDNGWAPAETTFWTSRREVEGAFGVELNWWRPGSFDPSTLRRAAAYLGIREITNVDSEARLLETWHGTVGERVEGHTRARWLKALHAWPGSLRASGYQEDAASDEALKALTQIEPELAFEMMGELTFAPASGPSVHARVQPRVLVKLEDGVLLSRDEDLLFSLDAAEALAACLPAAHLQATHALAALLAQAQNDLARLDEQSRKYEWTPTGPDPIEQPEDEEEDDPEEVIVKVGRRPRKGDRPKDRQAPPAPSPTPSPLADVDQYEPGTIESLDPNGDMGVPSSPPGGLRKPRSGGGDPGGERPNPRPRERYSNSDIENAAARFVAGFERQRGGFGLERQGPMVGADYVSMRGDQVDRFIEIKSSRKSIDAFDMTRSERMASMKPEYVAKYWVYLVEHLGDGQDPTVTAVWNPVKDERVSKEPKGAIGVRGWRAAQRQSSLTFTHAAGSTDSAAESTDDSSG